MAPPVLLFTNCGAVYSSVSAGSLLFGLLACFPAIHKYTVSSIGRNMQMLPEIVEEFKRFSNVTIIVMAFGMVKSMVGFLLLLNFCMYSVVCAIAGWALNNALDHTYSTGPGRALPVGFSPLYFPMGNEPTGFMIIFALIAGVVGAASCLSGLHHLRVWTAESLASNAASAMTAWALTLLALGLACKEIHIGGRNTKLITLESFLIILCGTKLFYILFIHGGLFGGNYCSYQDTYVATTTAEPQKGSTPVDSSV